MFLSCFFFEFVNLNLWIPALSPDDIYFPKDRKHWCVFASSKSISTACWREQCRWLITSTRLTGVQIRAHQFERYIYHKTSVMLFAPASPHACWGSPNSAYWIHNRSQGNARKKSAILKCSLWLGFALHSKLHLYRSQDTYLGIKTSKVRRCIAPSKSVCITSV